MAAVYKGRYTWQGQRDSEGHREYAIVFRVRTTAFTDGPATVLNCPGIPSIGSLWQFGTDVDMWAFRHPDTRAAIHQEREGDPNKEWRLECKFSTRPLKRCQDNKIEDPLLEPQKVSGSFLKKTREGVKDKDGEFIRTSSFETFPGQNNQWDNSKPTVRVEQNVSQLQLPLIASMMDHLNDAPLWGLDARCIKLSNCSWERLVWGTCDFYYRRSFDFEIDPETFDRDFLDQGTKALKGFWSGSATGTGPLGEWELEVIAEYDWNTYEWTYRYGDETSQGDFIQIKDRNEENIKCFLDGHGIPVSNVEDAANIHVEYYKEADFLLLGIPTGLEQA